MDFTPLTYVTMKMPNLSKMEWRGGAKSLYHLKSYENAQELHSPHQ